ncbi:hypothetical protein SAZ11_31370 [Streptomyces sp. FXJ1.4098]|nr:hypothetical protein [Streptomyces sp. FXJ1.4098]
MARQRSTMPRNGCAISLSAGGSCTTWYAVRYGLSPSKGPLPVAAYTSSAPSEKTSEAPVTSRGLLSCSGT